MASFSICWFSFILLVLFFNNGVNGGISRANFYEYGPSTGDTTMPAGEGFGTTDIIAPLNIHFPYFESIVTGMTLYVGGYIYVAQISGFITPYAADDDTTFGGTVYYRQTNNPTILEKGRLEVIFQYPQQSSFQPLSANIITWLDIPFWGQISPNMCNDQSLDKRNTFQGILLTDGTLSFAIFYYEKITWYSLGIHVGDCTGLGPQQAIVEFAKNNVTRFPFGGSGTPSVINIGDGTNYVCFDGDSSGRYIHQVDGSTPVAPEPRDCSVPECPVLQAPENGQVSVDNGQSVGSVAQFSCNPGYVLDGSSQLTCEQVSSSPPDWNGEPPICNSICVIRPREKDSHSRRQN